MSKKLENFISDLKINVNYQKVLDRRENLTKAVLQKKDENNEVFVPTNVRKNYHIYFAIDNVDLNIDKWSGKRDNCMELERMFIRKNLKKMR